MNNDILIKETFWEFEDDPIQSPCVHGQIIPGHACYCNNNHENADRKCPIWKWNDE